MSCRSSRCELKAGGKRWPEDLARAVRDAAWHGRARQLTPKSRTGTRVQKGATDSDFAFKRPHHLVHLSHLFLPRPVLQIDSLQLLHIPLPDFPSRRDDPILEPPLEMRRVLDEAEVEPVQGGGARLGERGRGRAEREGGAVRAEGSEEGRGGETRRWRGSRSGRQEGSAASHTRLSAAVFSRARYMGKGRCQAVHSRARDDFVPRPERAEIPVERGEKLFRQRGEISIYSRVAGRVCPCVCPRRLS